MRYIITLLWLVLSTLSINAATFVEEISTAKDFGSFACNGTLVGHVTSENAGFEDLEGVAIYINDDAFGCTNLVYTDASGNYTIPVYTSGFALFVASKEGFETIVDSFFDPTQGVFNFDMVAE